MRLRWDTTSKRKLWKQSTRATCGRHSGMNTNQLEICVSFEEEKMKMNTQIEVLLYVYLLRGIKEGVISLISV